MRFFVVVCLSLLASLPHAFAAEPLIHKAQAQNPSLAYRWIDVLLEASGRDVDRNKARPTILSRQMAIVVTAMYDAWSAYDATAVSTRTGGKYRRPERERTMKNKETAVSYAAYRALLNHYSEDRVWLSEQMKTMGYDPTNASVDPKTAAGIGNLSAKHVLDYRRNDGANQYGDEVGGNGKPYSDFTFYRPKNTPDDINDPISWFPIEFSDGKGGVITPGFLTPHWYRVKPLILDSAEQFRPPPPPAYGSKELERDVQEVVDANANLTLEQKATVEFMRDGPRSTGQSGHWLQFAQDVSRRDRNTLDLDIKMYFAVGNVVFDAFIACWEVKRYYDAGRPYWWVRIYNKGKMIRGWLGPGKGTGKIPAEKWHPYSPDVFITPPFPGYVSGHANVSGAAAKILELITGADAFGAVAVQTVGAYTEADFTTAQMQSVDGVLAKNVSTSKEVRLNLPTFSATADMAAVSRLWGGYHIRSDNDEGLRLGRRIAQFSWPIYESYFNGTAAIRK